MSWKRMPDGPRSQVGGKRLGKAGGVGFIAASRMRSLLNFLANLFGRGSLRRNDPKKSKLMGMYLTEANELSRTQFEVRRNRERQHGKSFTNRERA